MKITTIRDIQFDMGHPDIKKGTELTLVKMWSEGDVKHFLADCKDPNVGITVALHVKDNLKVEEE